MGAVRLLLVEASDADALLLEKTLRKDKIDVDINRVVKSRLSRLAPAIRREAASGSTRRREERALRERVGRRRAPRVSRRSGAKSRA